MTEKLYILGHPVAHSKSPAMHNAVYRLLALDWRYGFADCATPEEARAFISGPDWLGLNVTMPYKPLAYRSATWATGAAQAAEGANVLVRRGGELFADNTDGKGCVTFLRRSGVEFDGARVVVCGTGPTSLAILHACADAGAAQVCLLGRDATRAQSKLAESLARIPADASRERRLSAGDYATGREQLARATLVVDATPLGMKPGDPAPFDTSVLSAGQVVFDVVYGHGETALGKAARAAGCRAYDGEGMLVAQAVETVRDLIDWLALDVPFDESALFETMSCALWKKPARSHRPATVAPIPTGSPAAQSVDQNIV